MTDEQAAEIIARLTAVEAENKALKEKVDAKEGFDFADGIPGHFKNSDPSIGGVDAGKFARRVVMISGGGQALAEEYAKTKGIENVVDAGGLVQNSQSNPMKEG